VRVHPETARPSLFVNAQYTIGLAGFARQEAKPILDFLFEHTVDPLFTCRWRWKGGDVAMWDNRCLQHMAMADFTGHRRFLHRTTVAGDRPRAMATTK
jgi:taurine dioxygenase